MTAGSPTFLSRLGPLAAISPFAVRAALPARYAPSSGQLRSDEQVESDVPWERAPRGPDAKIAAGADRTEWRAPNVSERDAGIGLSKVPDRSLRAAGRPAVAEPTVSLKVQDSASPRAITVDPVRMPLVGSSKPDTPDAAANPAQRDRPAFTAARLKSHAMPGPESSGPLTRGTVIERGLAAPSGKPDVVQVTIDRIDIRMPPEAGQAAGRAEPRRRCSPTMSLSDYLRGADSARRSGG